MPSPLQPLEASWGCVRGFWAPLGSALGACWQQRPMAVQLVICTLGSTGISVRRRSLTDIRRFSKNLTSECLAMPAFAPVGTFRLQLLTNAEKADLWEIQSFPGCFAGSALDIANLDDVECDSESQPLSLYEFWVKPLSGRAYMRSQQRSRANRRRRRRPARNPATRSTSPPRSLSSSPSGTASLDPSNAVSGQELAAMRESSSALKDPTPSSEPLQTAIVEPANASPDLSSAVSEQEVAATRQSISEPQDSTPLSGPLRTAIAEPANENEAAQWSLYRKIRTGHYIDQDDIPRRINVLTQSYNNLRPHLLMHLFHMEIPPAVLAKSRPVIPADSMVSLNSNIHSPACGSMTASYSTAKIHIFWHL